MDQSVPTLPSFSFVIEVLEDTDHFRYLGFTVSSNLLLDREMYKRVAKAASDLAKLSKRTPN